MNSRIRIKFAFYCTEADVKCHVAVVKRLPLLNQSADNISISFRLMGSILVTLKIELLGGVYSLVIYAFFFVFFVFKSNPLNLHVTAL